MQAKEYLEKRGWTVAEGDWWTDAEFKHNAVARFKALQVQHNRDAAELDEVKAERDRLQSELSAATSKAEALKRVHSWAKTIARRWDANGALGQPMSSLQAALDDYAALPRAQTGTRGGDGG